MKIKVCGMKYPENMSEVASLKPDYMGFIFWEPSARSFSGSLPSLPSQVRKVGVFVNEAILSILEKTAEYSLDLIQLHGDETPEYCASLRNALNGVYSSEKNSDRLVGIIKAISMGGPYPFDELRAYQGSVDYFLFDSKGPLPGGNGYAFDWRLLRNYNLDTPYFLSGGIGMKELENLRNFMSTPLAEKCCAIDVNSAFEIEPGLKDPERLQNFIKEIKRVEI
jgi:phosphoribosylanthranilate isomerase